MLVLKKYTFEILLLLSIIIINLIFTQLPLLNILSYESSAINAVLFSFIVGYYSIKARETSKKKYIIFITILFIIPIIILSISTILCQQCPLDDGLYFYLVLTFPSIIIGLAIARLSLFISFRFTYFIFFTIWLLLLFSFLPELYFNPQIYFYNAIYGYFPGVIYDQHVSISTNLILYRILNILFSTIVIWVTYKAKNASSVVKYFAMFLIALGYITFSYLKPTLILSTNIDRIKEELKGEIITDHFRILYPENISNTEKKLLEFNHEYYYNEIKNILKSEPSEKITSIVFNSRKQKKKLFGAANADVAKPWLNQIYLSYSNYEGSLKHELAHIFSANFADGYFSLPSNYNPGLIEGFAMAVENNYNENDIDYLAALAFINKYKVSLQSLFSSFSFFSNASSLSYIYAGSFIKYLSNKYGWEKIKEIYSGKGFYKVFKKDVLELEKEYYIYLKSIELKNSEHKTNFYFGRKPLIKKICARATAKELKNAQKLFLNKEYENSSNLYLKIFDYSRTYSALIGYLHSQRELGNVKEAKNYLYSRIDNYSASSSFYYLELLLADLYALNDNKDSSKIYYEKIIQQNPHQNYKRSAEIKTDLLNEADSVYSRYLKDIDFRKNTILKKIRSKPSNIYIQALPSLAKQEYLELKKVLNNCSDFQKISSETYFHLSKIALQHLDLEQAIRYSNLSLDNVTFEREAIFLEHLDKLNWIKTKYINNSSTM